MFEKIDEYILKTKEERQAHLDLNEQCIEIGGDSKKCQGLLAYFLKTTFPTTRRIMICHACHNGKCSNVKHLYWGNMSENTKDSYKSGKRKPSGFGAMSKKLHKRISSKGGLGNKKK